MTTHAAPWKSTLEPFGRVMVAAAVVVTARLRHLAIALRHRHDAAVLMRFDDRMLADIGLTRRDVREAFDEPVWRDPTELLVNRLAWRRPARVKVRVAPSIVPQIGGARAIECRLRRF
jgi:uncharacterized protein YjiS (DUF1127 family)